MGVRAVTRHSRPRRHRAGRLRRALLGTVGGLVCGALTVGGTLHAAAATETRTPSTSAADAGVTAAGGGYAGWAVRRQLAEHPTSKDTKAVAPDGTMTPMATTSTVPGIDVAAYQGNVNWSSWWSKGKRFAYVKATEGTSYRNPYFSQQYTGSYNVGMIRGAYHFGRPDGAAGYLQARYFVSHGGGWSRDGRTLPGALDIEDNYTGGGRCWGNTDAENRAWIASFVNEYKRLTGRDVVIYTNNAFWRDCVATTSFSRTNPLWIAYWSSTPPSTLRGGWSYWTFWQYSGSGTDLDKFSAGLDRLKVLATG